MVSEISVLREMSVSSFFARASTICNPDKAQLWILINYAKRFCTVMFRGTTWPIFVFNVEITTSKMSKLLSDGEISYSIRLVFPQISSRVCNSVGAFRKQNFKMNLKYCFETSISKSTKRRLMEPGWVALEPPDHFMIMNNNHFPTLVFT